MTDGEIKIALFSALASLVLSGLWFFFSVLPAAYRDGVTDGYGYAKSPNSPSHAIAGKYLRENMSHRWPELKDEPVSKFRRSPSITEFDGTVPPHVRPHD